MLSHCCNSVSASIQRLNHAGSTPTVIAKPSPAVRCRHDREYHTFHRCDCLSVIFAELHGATVRKQAKPADMPPDTS